MCKLDKGGTNLYVDLINSEPYRHKLTRRESRSKKEFSTLSFTLKLTCPKSKMT